MNIKRIAKFGAMTTAMSLALVMAACGEKESEDQAATTEEASTEAATTSTDASETSTDVTAAVPAEGVEPGKEKPVILVVGRQQIFAASKAGADMRTKLQTIQEEIVADREKEMDTLIKDAQDLQQKRALVSQEQFQKEQVELGRREEFIKFKFSKELEAAEDSGQTQIMQALFPILQDLMVEKNGTLLMDQSSVLMVSADYNITAAAIEKLDVALPAIELERILYDDLVKMAQEVVEQRQAAQKAAEEAAAQE